MKSITLTVAIALFILSTLLFTISANASPATPQAACVAGMAGIYPCNNVDLLAFVPIGAMGSSGKGGSDLWGWTDPLTGKEYAIMARNNGTSFFDVSIPTAPVMLANLPSASSQVRSQRDIKILQDHALIVSESSGHGLQIYDLTQLRDLTNTTTITHTFLYTGFGSAHNIIVNPDTNFAYVAATDAGNDDDGCNNGLHFLDMSNILSPSFAGCFSEDGYTHDAQCLTYDSGPDSDFIGHEICLNANADTLTIVDVTDKNNPIMLSRSTYADSGYTHQGWLTADHRYLLLGDELDERNLGVNTRTYVWDVSSLISPTLQFVNEFASTAVDHNLYTKGQYSYHANYTSGLRIADISDLANNHMTEVAYFDVFPTNDAASFSGAWSVYPYFESGIVVVSAREGLFVLQPHLPVPTSISQLATSINQSPTSVILPFALLLLSITGSLYLGKWSNGHEKRFKLRQGTGS